MKKTMINIIINNLEVKVEDVDLNFSKDTAQNEAKRCLRCDLKSKGGK